MRPNSIRAHMTITLTLATALLMLVVCGGLITYNRMLAERNADKLLRVTIKQITTSLKEDDNEEGRPAPLEVMREFRDRLETNELAFAVADVRGDIVMQSHETVPLTAHPDNIAWRSASVLAGDYLIVIGFPWSKTNAALIREANVLIVLGLFVTALSSIGAWWLVGRTLTPIHRLSQQVNTASVDNLNLRLTASSQDVEIVELVDTMNSLLERIAHVAAMRSRFYAAASHELRTPLYVLVGSLEVALNRERSREEYRDALRVADTQSKQLSVLVRDLLSLNQLDFMPTPPPAETVDLPDLLCSILVSFQELSDHKRLKVETDLPTDGRLEAPPAHLEMLMRNLIENAIKYTPEEGGVSVQMIRGSGDMTLILRNDYPPVPRLDCNQLFEPFYRPDSSRNIHSGGNGLGLAICKAIATTNRWPLTLEQTDQGICVTVIIRSEP